MEENKFSLNIEKVNEILKEYKKDFPKYFPEEKYKWQAIKHFQSTWDIDAVDFTAMFENATSKASNLLTSINYFPRGMILDFCKENSEKVRAMFKNLFDENIDLSKRFESFRKESDEFLQVFNGTKKNHFQNTNSISVYLWLRFPEKYYIYKYSEYIKVADILSENYQPKKGDVRSVINGFVFYDKIRNFLKTDSDLIDLLNSNLDETCWNDKEFHTLTFDFGFYISRYLKSSWIVAANPKYYDVHSAFKKFSVLDWKQGNQNISEGDTVYIYISDEIKRIEYKTVVLKTNMEKSEIDDSEFQIDNSNYADSKKMQLQLMDSVETEELSFSNLQRNGLKTTLQSPEKITTKLIDYIEQFFGGVKMAAKNNYDDYVKLLKSNHNIILHGAPGTGKTHLAKKIANAMGEKGDGTDVEIGFVQFHPSYDYTDFVEGLRPKKEGSQIVFESKDGVFKEFCKLAVKNLIESQKKPEERQQEKTIEEQLNYFLTDAVENDAQFELLGRKTKFNIKDFDEKKIYIVADNKIAKDIEIKISDIIAVLSSKENLTKAGDVAKFFNHPNYGYQSDSYVYALYTKLKSVSTTVEPKVLENNIDCKNFIFVIDEINRGEISKIFGELFFSIDPGYRGEKGAVKTQYANLCDVPNEFDAVLKKSEKDYGWFFIPENVYIIGTMNDIDRSVESMDFAMRRRFVFKEITAAESAENMNLGAEANRRMTALNDAISKIDGLGASYHIGAAYFLKEGKSISENKDFDELWELRLESLLTEYLRGTGNESKLKDLKDAYEKGEPNSDNSEGGE